MTFAFSHNPDDLVDWVWVLLTFALVIGFFMTLMAVFLRWAHARRRDHDQRSGGARR